AKDAPGTIERLLDLGINRVDIMQTLIAVASIQLVPITQDNQEPKRAAIVELLDGLLLQNMIEGRSEEHTSELQSRFDIVCCLLLTPEMHPLPLHDALPILQKMPPERLKGYLILV